MNDYCIILALMDGHPQLTSKCFQTLKTITKLLHGLTLHHQMLFTTLHVFMKLFSWA